MASLPLFPDHAGAACACAGAPAALAEGLARARQPAARRAAEATVTPIAFGQATLEQAAVERIACEPDAFAPTSSERTAGAPRGRAAVEPDATSAAASDPAPIVRSASAARGTGFTLGGQAAAAAASASIGRGATLQRLASLWRADEIAQAVGPGATIASGFAALDAELPGGGWPQGQLIELLLDAPGIGELSLLAPALARCTRDARACVWVLPGGRAAAALPALPYPPALAASGVDLARALFVQPEAPREAFWAIEQSLRAAHLGALVGWLPQAPASRAGEFRALRRLQLLAGRQQALVFLLRDARALHAPSPAALRLQLAAREGSLAVTLLKRRGRPLLEPVTLQVHPAHWALASGIAAGDAPAVPAQPAGRPAPMAPTTPHRPPEAALSI